MAEVSFNNQKFTRQLEETSKRLEMRERSLIRDVTEFAFKDIRNQTPVKSGRARRSWKKRVTAKGGRIWSALFYIRFIERGTVSQSGSFMVSRAVRRFRRYVRRAVARLR